MVRIAKQATSPTPTQMADGLDEHLPYEVGMLFATYEALCPPGRIVGVNLNIVIESFCIHARNLFEFFTRSRSGTDNYAFASAYVSNFAAFRTPEARATKDALYRKICAQISHLTFDREKGDSRDKFRSDRDVPETKRLLEPEIRAFVKDLSPEHRFHWDIGVDKCGLSRWGF